jgi:site-specific DNA-cytosine methylase
VKNVLVDLFSGIGGFHLGAEWAGIKFDKTYFSEVMPYAVSVYKKRFPQAIELGDVRSIDWKQVRGEIGEPAQVFATGGFP